LNVKFLLIPRLFLSAGYNEKTWQITRFPSTSSRWVSSAHFSSDELKVFSFISFFLVYVVLILQFLIEPLSYSYTWIVKIYSLWNTCIDFFDWPSLGKWNWVLPCCFSFPEYFLLFCLTTFSWTRILLRPWSTNHSVSNCLLKKLKFILTDFLFS
jgi:hypothetical protein